MTTLIGKGLACVATLLLLASSSYLAGQDPPLRSTGQEMAGTWLLDVRPPTGSPFPLIVTFHADGTATAAAPDANSTVELGAWVRTGDRQFHLILMFFTFDATTRNFNGSVKGRTTISLGDTLDSFRGTTERVVLDPSGAEVQVFPGIPSTARRLAVERQATPVAPADNSRR